MIKEENTEQINPHIHTYRGIKSLKLDINDKNVGEVENIFSNLPSDLSEIQIRNFSRKNIILNVPDSIGSFSNLAHVTLDNCVSSIPESVCQLSKLKFFGLTNNRELKSIPECINDMENLIFLNLKGSSVETRIDGLHLGGGMWDMTREERPREKTKEEKLQELQFELQKIQNMIAKLENS
jgi:hypothetical protein